MTKYDVIIIGGSTTGCWFAKQMSKRGHSVLLLEKEDKENISRHYDIVHMSKDEIIEHDLHLPSENDSDFAFFFEGSPAYSPYGNYPKISKNPAITVGLHKHTYILKMQELAKNTGAEIINGAQFLDFIKNDKDKRIGVKYKINEEICEVFGNLIADCSGIPSVARTKLPDNSTVENFSLTNKDLFYVVLYYIKYKDKNINPNDYHGFFLNYKSWSAPSGDEHGAILGIGGCYGYEYAEAVFEDFKNNYKLPEYTIEKVEKWVTPYHRGIYSFVDDNFIVMGDAACLTKPNNGEGCTSSLVQGKIAVETIDRLLKNNKPLTKENLWEINLKYIKTQGASFDSLRPMLMGIVTPDYNEAEYLFANDLIYSKKILASDGEELNFTTKEIIDMVFGITKAVAKKKVKPSTVGAVIKGILNGGKVTKLYNNYPNTPDQYFEWKQSADKLWNEIGSVCDTCDKNLLKKLGFVE